MKNCTSSSDFGEVHGEADYQEVLGCSGHAL